MMEFQKNLQIKVTRKRQLQYDMCSYFGFYDYPYLNIFAGSNKNTSQINTKNSAVKMIGREMPQHGQFYFEVDSCFVVSSSYFWIIGAHHSIIVIHMQLYSNYWSIFQDKIVDREILLWAIMTGGILKNYTKNQNCSQKLGKNGLMDPHYQLDWNSQMLVDYHWTEAKFYLLELLDIPLRRIQIT